MPRESLSVYLTAVDNMSPVMASITDKTKALDKESQELKQTFDALQKANKGLIDRKVDLEAELKKVNKEVSEAKKNFNALKDEASEDAYKKAQENQQKLRNEITATNKALQENQKIYKENIETIRKGDVGEGGTSLKDMAKGIFAGQIGQMFSSAVGGALESGLTSAIGTPTASLISDTLSSAIAGGAAGAIFGPAGVAVGAALGGMSGLVSGGTKIFEARDDAFKDYYGGLYEDVKGRSGEMVEAGTSLASSRETNRISFTTLFDGDEDRARSYLGDLIDMANSTPFLYDDLVGMSKTLATYGYDDTNILPLLQTIGDTGAALGMGTSDMTAVAQALGRMESSNKATLEYLNILNDRGIGAVGYLAEAKGVSVGDVYGMISKGQISGTEAVEIITAALEKAYAGSMETQSQTFSGLSSTLEGLQQNLNALGGEGYNTLRRSGLREEINALDGALGDSIGEINRIMGENQARRENLQDQYMREVLDAVLNGGQGELWAKFSESQQAELTEMSQQYSELKARYDKGIDKLETGEELEALYEHAQALGQAYYDNSDEVSQLNSIEEQHIEAIRDSIAPLEIAHQRLYELNQTLSKGLGASTFSDASLYASRRDYALRSRDDGEQARTSQIKERRDLQGSRSHAYGLERVPYDGYPALLHEGERVLTAAQARAQDAGQGGVPPIQITITGNSFTGDLEEMADQLAEIIVRKVRQAVVAAAPK